MNRPETTRLLALLCTEYRKEVIDDDRITLWHGVLAEIPLDRALQAAAAWLSDADKSRFFPRPGEFAELAGSGQARSRLYHRYSELRNADDLTPAEEAEFRRVDCALFGRGAWAVDAPQTAAIGAGR